MDNIHSRDGPDNGLTEMPQHATQILQSLNQLRKQGELCDVVLKVGACRVPAHRAVLASCSQYFRAMFTGSLCEREKEEIELKSVDETALQTLVEFAYTGKVRVTHANVQTLLPAASLLQLKPVIKICCDFLEAHLHATNCIGISCFADTHACTDLHRTAQAFIARHFEELSTSEEFLQVEHSDLASILSQDDLLIGSEEAVFNALDSWVRYDPNKRGCYMGKLLHCVRLPLMTLQTLTGLYEANPFIRDNPSCQEQVNRALRYHLRPEERLHVARKMGARVKTRGEKGLLCAMGGKNGLFATLDSVEVYHLDNNVWSEVAPLSCRRQECAAVAIQQTLYVTGGIISELRNGSMCRRHDNGTECWSPATNAWTKVASMQTSRSNHGVAVLNGTIYALGGYTGQLYLRSVECYDPKTNQWKDVAPMINSRSIFSAAVVDGKLYAIGGYGPNYLNSVERYDPDLDTWEMVAPMADKRINFGVGVIHGFIYVVGGHNGERHLSSVEQYNPTQGTWTTVASMNTTRTGLGVAVLDGMLYAAGGHSGSTYLDLMERYDPYNDTWSIVRSMINCRCNFAFAAL
ncbi:kelch-like protein 28 [Acanthaster planci]|uniref:Kelch-like protein 28 n=1 Tax=Acanthaster planci TaxID=133434 RepID=A0A8B7XSD4_ACAPL|nr:kelch-like protein 28 [Acanthaster planci]